MSYESGHHSHHIRREIKKQLLFLSGETIYIWQQCRSRAIETIEKGQRFSLISRSDYQVSFPAQAVRNLHRRSVPSEQICGYHVVCGRCDGFVVKNGVIRNCRHQRDSSSTISIKDSRERGRGSAGQSSPQATNNVRISVQPPTPTSSPEPITRGKPHRSDSLRLKDTLAGPEMLSKKFENREPVPAVLRPGYRDDHQAGRTGDCIGETVHPNRSVPSILRPGHVIQNRDARTTEITGETMKSNNSVPFGYLGPAAASDSDEADLSLRAGDAAEGTRLNRPKVARANSDSDDDDSTDQFHSSPEDLMQEWREWSESWEQLISEARPSVSNSGNTDRANCDTEFLMQEWREWSERWERSLRSTMS